MKATAGYSGTPLPAKLGLKAGMKFVALSAPPDLDSLLAGAPDLQRLTRVASFECALAFAASERTLSAHFSKLAPKLLDAGMIWIAWPKKSSGIATELTEDVVRRARSLLYGAGARILRCQPELRANEFAPTNLPNYARRRRAS